MRFVSHEAVLNAVLDAYVEISGTEGLQKLLVEQFHFKNSISILDTIGLLVSELSETKVVSKDGDILINLDMSIVE